MVPELAEGGMLAAVYFMMDLKKKRYARSVGKIDNLLSYTGGLFSILIGFLSFFLMSFNMYRYELKIAEGAFNIDKTGRKMK